MNNTKKTNDEGGTDLEGFQEFLINVDESLFEGGQSPQPEIEIVTGEEPEVVEEKEEPTPEEKKPEVKEETPKEEEPQPQQNKGDSYYGKLATKFLEKGKWQDAEIELEEGKVVKLSELEEMDEELFFQIQENQDKFKDEEIQTNYVSTKGIDENKRKLIEFIKEGGDIKEVYKTPQEAKRPFEDLNIEDEAIQKSIMLNYLTQVKELNEEDAKVILGNYEKRGELDGTVNEIVTAYQKDYDNKLESKLEELKTKKTEQAKKDKETTKRLEEIYKESKLDEKLARRLSTLGTKRNKEGDYELDNLYTERLENPEEAAELIFFLNDKEGYLKSKMAATRIATQKENLKSIKLIKTSTKVDKDKKETLNKGEEPFLININQ